MLAQLFINNIAVIERASIDLEKGFTVLTGETGAGKSIIIDAIHAVLGGTDLERVGAYRSKKRFCFCTFYLGQRGGHG